LVAALSESTARASWLADVRFPAGLRHVNPLGDLGWPRILSFSDCRRARLPIEELLRGKHYPTCAAAAYRERTCPEGVVSPPLRLTLAFWPIAFALPIWRCPLREFFSLVLPALRRIDDRDSEIYCRGTIRMHVLRFFLTRPSVPMQGCAPARRRIRVLTLSKQLSLRLANSLTPALSIIPTVLSLLSADL
jgi:hypothetical protein